MNRVPANQAGQARYGRLPSGRVVRLVPVQTLPKMKQPIKQRTKKYDVRHRAAQPGSISRQGMYKKQQLQIQQLQNGQGVMVARRPSIPQYRYANGNGTIQTDAGYSTITYPHEEYHRGSYHGSTTGWHSLSMMDKVTV